MQTAVWWGNLKKRDHLDVLDVDGRTVKLFIMKKRRGILWNVQFWLRRGTSGRLLLTL